MFTDEHFMREALKQATYAFEEGEIPVGAVVVCKNKIIARAYNQTEKLNDATAHAEMIAMTSASNALNSRYLKECTLYVTLEPCVMCAGASHWAQFEAIVFGASDAQRGYARLSDNVLHPKTEVRSGVMKNECKSLIDDFFRQLRK